MKTCKKLLACLLSIALVMSFVIIPTAVSADEAPITKNISLLDLTNADVTADSASLPTALSDRGYATYADGWNTGHAFNGTMAIAMNDSAKAWKITFGPASSGNNNYCDISNEFMVRVAVPAKYVPYVTGVSLKATASAADLGYRYCFGVSDGSGNYGKNYKGQWTTVAGNINDNLTVSTLQKKGAWASFNGDAETTDTWGDTAVNYVFLNLASPGSGYLMVDDISITISGAADVINSIPATYNLELLDLSSCATGALTAYPDGMAAVRDSFTGAKTVVDVNGKKALKLDTSVMTGTGSDKLAEGGYNGEAFGLGIDIPAGLIPYISKITYKFDKQMEGQMCGFFSVASTTQYGKVYDVNQTVPAANTGMQTINIVPNNTNKVDGVWYFDHWGSTGTKFNNDYSKAFIYFQATTNTGYVTLTSINVEYNCTQDQLDSMPVTHKLNLLDFSSCELGAITSAQYPKGIADYSNSFSGTKSIVEVAGKKALQIDTSTLTGTGSDKFSEGGYNEKFGISANIPTYLTPFISEIQYKFNKDMSGQMCGFFGVTDGTSYSKAGPTNDTVAAATSGAVVVTRNPRDLYKLDNGWYFGNYGGTGGAKWTTEYTKAMIFFGATNNTGSVTLTGIYVTYTCTNDELNAAIADFNANRTKINDFEVGGTETPYAAGGTKAFAASNSGWNTPSPMITFEGNETLADASGFTYWTYSEAARSVMMTIIASDGTEYTRRADVAPGFQKHIISFSEMCFKNGDNFSWFSGANANLTQAQIEGLATVRFLDLSRSGSIVYYDDFYFTLNKTAVASTSLDLSSSTGVTAADGKLFFPASAEGTTAAATIAVPAGTFSEASTFKFNYDCTSTAANYRMRLVGTDAMGNTVHYAWASKNEYRTLTAGAEGTDQVFRFDAVADGTTWNVNVVHKNSGEACWDCSNDSGAQHHTMTPVELKNVTKVVIEINSNVGEDTTGVTINDFSITNGGKSPIAVTQPIGDTGSVSALDATVAIGETAGFVVSPVAGNYVKSISLTDEFGNDVAYEPAGSKDGKNVPYYYTFTMPEAKVYLTCEIEGIDSTVMVDEGYTDDNAYQVNFKIPFVNGAVYNSVDDASETLENYGAYICLASALEKYGLTADDLTVENVNNWTATGHNIAKYIYKVDFTDPDALATYQGVTSNEYSIKVTNLTRDLRRSNVAVSSFATFTDGSDVCVGNIMTLDQRHYGDGLATEFDPDSLGINYETSLLTATPGTGALSAARWDDFAAQGFATVRFPIALYTLLDADGHLDADKMAKLDTAMDYALKAGLAVIIDNHNGGIFDQYVSAWGEMAAHYADWPDALAFELVNEPGYREDLFDLEADALAAIRAEDPTKTVVVNSWNGGNVSFSSVPAAIVDDGNVVIDFHHYNPINFTHSGATWSVNEDGSLKYPAGATTFDEAQIYNWMITAANFEASTGIQTFIGEWGAYRPDATVKVTYYQKFAEYAAQYGLGWTLWEYGGGWSPTLSDGSWDTALLEAIGVQ